MNTRPSHIPHVLMLVIAAWLANGAGELTAYAQDVFDTGYFPYSIQQYTEIDIDTSNNVYGYTETYNTNFDYEGEVGPVWAQLEVTQGETELFVGEQNADSDAYLEYGGGATVGSTYTVAGTSSFCYEGGGGDGQGCEFDESLGVGELVVSETAQFGPPTVASVSPGGDVPGASGTLTVGGTNLANADGSLPYLSFNGSGVGFSVSAAASDGSSVTAQYFIASDATPVLGTYITLNTEAGSDIGDFEVQAPPAPPEITINQDKSLYYFGSGIQTPPNFSLGGTPVTFTASGVTGGSYSWSISDQTKATFDASGLEVSTATTSSNAVQIYGIGASDQINEETLTVQWTPPVSGVPVTAQTLFTVYAPYMLALSNTPTVTGAGSCGPATDGTLGWKSYYEYIMLDQGAHILLGMSFNEQFSNITDVESWGWGYATNGADDSGTDYKLGDSYCEVLSPATPLQTPPSARVITYATQTYSLGSSTPGLGVPVQTHTLTRYVDHPTVTDVVSPIP